jgi:ribulose-bisphosphate carboxylase large chain
LLGGDKSAGQQPKQTFHSACEWQGAATAAVERLDMLTQRQPFRWQGRVSEAYKEHQELPFKGIERQELIGQNGEQTAFDLRYFEIAPGGYSSWEKHQHEHVVIGARGQGQVVLGEDQRVLHPNDIVYIRPWQPHQFRNSSSQAFGFYCIVDHKRDRPRSVDGYASENTHSTLDGKAKGG